MFKVALTGMVCAVAAVGLGGCGMKYVTPGAAAELSVFADEAIKQQWQKKAVATFPAHLAVARVQGSGYSSYTVHSYGHGKYSVVTTRDVETDEHFQRIGALQDVAGVAAINRMLLPSQLNSDVELRTAAAALHAEMLLLYTFDTQFYADQVVPAAGLLTLGFFPDRSAHVDTTASALLLDTQTGYVYAAIEASAHEEQAANFWTSKDAADDARRRAEVAAFEGLVAEFEKAWPGVIARYGKTPRSTNTATGRVYSTTP